MTAPFELRARADTRFVYSGYSSHQWWITSHRRAVYAGGLVAVAAGAAFKRR